MLGLVVVVLDVVVVVVGRGTLFEVVVLALGLARCDSDVVVVALQHACLNRCSRLCS